MYAIIIRYIYSYILSNGFSYFYFSFLYTVYVLWNAKIECKDEELPYIGDGRLINSPLLDGLTKAKAINEIIEYLTAQGHLILDNEE